jgi:hypothetical protein
VHTCTCVHESVNEYMWLNQEKMSLVQEVVYIQVEGCGPPQCVSSLKRSLLQTVKVMYVREIAEMVIKQMSKRKENGAHHSHL